MKNKILITGLIMLSAVFVSLSGCGKKTDTSSVIKNVTSVVSNTVPNMPESSSSVSEIQTEPEKPAYTSPLSGKPLDEKYKDKRPFAFMFNNIEFAYPQTGTGRAEIIYEILAEGGITRLMGVFDYMKGDKIGSVRSARHYYVDFANEFDAIFVHFGQTHYAIDEIKKLGVDTISGLSWEGARAFYRDNNIRAPHNAFASTKGLMQAMKDKKLRTKPKKGISSHFNFSQDEEVNNDKKDSFKADYAKIPFSAYMTPWFTFSKKDKLYTRYAFGTKHIDKGTGKALKFKNIFIQLVNEYNKDRNGYQTMDLINQSGNAYYITNGRGIKVYWEKKGGADKTGFYYDKAHTEEVRVNTGKTYYAVFPVNRKEMITFKKK
ncbi:MAG: DUF3048 domain-containing protein [Catonella sp.]|uniref:DUF3048 domain-containing protein n=1 Tax=Catonella sp. TaxID=2382125 RepID=UPI003FA1310A